MSETINIFKKLHKTNTFGMPSENVVVYVNVAPNNDNELLNRNLPFKLILRMFEAVFSDVWSENGAIFEKRLMEIHAYPSIFYYGHYPLLY